MKKLCLVLFFVTLSFSFNFEIGPSINLLNEYQLRCSGAYGNVKYYATNLPYGVQLQGDKIKIVDKNAVENGIQTIRLKAQDSYGHSDERLIVLVINKKTIKKVVAQEAVTTTSTLKKTIQDKQRVNTVLEELEVPGSVDGQFQYPENGYPTGNFPTGVNPDLVNFAPNDIETRQAPRSDENRNQITADDVRSRAIFERQLNAAKALGNLLSIVKQATANRNAALIEIEKRTEIFEAATAAQRQAEANIASAQNELARVRKGIETTNEEVNSLREQIDDLISQKQKKQAERQSLIIGIKTARQSLNSVTNEIHENEVAINNAERDLEDKQMQVESLDEEKSITEGELNQKNKEKEIVENKIDTATDKVNSDKERINNLMKQLADAEASLKQSEQDLKNLNEENENISQTIEGLQKRLDDLINRINKGQKEFDTIKQKIQELNKQNRSLTNKKSSIQSEIQSLTQKFDGITKELEQLPQQIDQLQKQLNDFITKLRFLRSQIFIFQNRLRTAYNQGNDANQKALVAKQNLEAANQRFIKESEIIEEATYNIQIARVEKEKADLAVEDHLREDVDILPFAGAPGEKGFQPIGGGQYAIKSWEDYVRIAFGRGVNPLFVGDLDTLFEIKTGGSNIRGNEECQSDGLTAISGYILQIKQNSFIVITDDGTQYEVVSNKCTISLSSANNYTLTPGDIIVLKGTKQGNKITATQLTSVRR